MERLNRAAPIKKLTDDQKRQLAELDSRYGAKLAEREITLQADVTRAEAQGDAEAAAKARQLLQSERQKLQGELESKKDRIRDAR